MSNIDKILPTLSQVDDLIKMGSVLEKTTENIIASGDLKKGKCQYYSNRSKSCSLCSCRHGHRIIDENKIARCNTNGIIDDLHQEYEPEHNYFKSRG